MTVNEALIILKELRDAYIESELVARFSDEYVERVVKKRIEAIETVLKAASEMTEEEIQREMEQEG